MLLATDYPYDNPQECMAFLESLRLSEPVQKKLFYQNAKRIGITA